MHLFCTRVRFGRSRSSKVDDFGTNRKRVCSLHLAPFLQIGRPLAKNGLFFLPLSHSAPSLPMFHLEFRTEVNHEETRIIGLSSSEDPMIVA